MAGAVGRARAGFGRRGWAEAYDGLFSVRDSLGPDDLERLAVAGYLTGREHESDAAWAHAYRLRLADLDREGAGRCAFWIGFRLINAHEFPAANGWIARLGRLAHDLSSRSLARARLAYLTGLRAVFDDGNLETAAIDLGRSAELASTLEDDELIALARLALGRVLIFQGHVTDGVRLLDEAMLTVVLDQLSPIAVGDSYCTAIDACHDLVDVRRGRDWTEGLTRWCDEQPDLVPFAGICQVHRSEFLQMRGAWDEAMQQAALARVRLSRPFRQLLYGAAAYQEGELRRLRGDTAGAEACYREASEAGRDPQPGLALLRLAQGRGEEAARALERAVVELDDPLLPVAYVEVLLACGRVDDARRKTSALEEAARALGGPVVGALSARARGAVALAEHDPAAALGQLRRASDVFREHELPYEVARTSVLIGHARRALGDEEGARLELDAAMATFERLGAAPDLAPLNDDRRGALTARELQVLRLVADGRTNRAIGTTLDLSERTVDRHVSNIFTKLGVSSRAAATAAAYESGLI